MHHAMAAEKLTLPATLNSLTRLGNALRRFLQPLQLPESWIYPLDLALCEAASNIIRHGYQDDAQQHYRVHFSCDEQGVTVTLSDNGRPVPEAFTERAQRGFDDIDPLDEGGRGWPLIYASVDRVSYQRQPAENQLTLWRALPGV